MQYTTVKYDGKERKLCVDDFVDFLMAYGDKRAEMAKLPRGSSRDPIKNEQRRALAQDVYEMQRNGVEAELVRFVTMALVAFDDKQFPYRCAGCNQGFHSADTFISHATEPECFAALAIFVENARTH